MKIKLRKNNMAGLYLVFGMALFMIIGDIGRVKADSESSILTQEQITEQIVIMKDLRFMPETITVKKGTEVFWTNEDSVNHQISADSGPILFDSEGIRPGEEYSYTFDTPGTYDYHCNIHPFMRGTVIVVE